MVDFASGTKRQCLLRKLLWYGLIIFKTHVLVVKRVLTRALNDATAHLQGVFGRMLVVALLEALLDGVLDVTFHVVESRLEIVPLCLEGVEFEALTFDEVVFQVEGKLPRLLLRRFIDMTHVLRKLV